MRRLLTTALCAGVVVCGSSATSQEAQSYVYDAHGRLTTAYRETASSSQVTTYGLDGADNRTGRSTAATFAQVWEAEALYHIVGFAEADGWAGNINQPEGFLTYGPYAAVPVGSRTAVWRMMVDAVNVAGSAPTIRLEVYDATAGQVLATRFLNHAAWRANWTYQFFELPFVLDAGRAGHSIEFRTYFIPIAHVRVDKVGYR